MDCDVKTNFVRMSGVLRQFPAIVLKTGYRLLCRFDLSEWPMLGPMAAAKLKSATFGSAFDHALRSQCVDIRQPSGVVPKDINRPSKRVAFTRLIFFKMAGFCSQGSIAAYSVAAIGVIKRYLCARKTSVLFAGFSECHT
jgi:hypothetical protein